MRPMTSDELLRRFAAVRGKRDKLRSERAACTCERQGANGYETQDGPCWKTLRVFKEDIQQWIFHTARWCASCRRRHEMHEALRQASREHGTALRGLLRRGHALLGVKQKPARHAVDSRTEE